MTRLGEEAAKWDETCLGEGQRVLLVAVCDGGERRGRRKGCAVVLRRFEVRASSSIECCACTCDNLAVYVGENAVASRGLRAVK